MKYTTLMGLLVSLSALAQNRPNHAEMEAKLQAACGSDISSLCGSAEGREKFRCLMENKSSLSEACTTFLAQAPKHGPPPHDGQRPPGPPPGEGAGSSR